MKLVPTILSVTMALFMALTIGCSKKADLKAPLTLLDPDTGPVDTEEGQTDSPSEDGTGADPDGPSQPQAPRLIFSKSAGAAETTNYFYKDAVYVRAEKVPANSRMRGCYEPEQGNFGMPKCADANPEASGGPWVDIGAPWEYISSKGYWEYSGAFSIEHLNTGLHRFYVYDLVTRKLSNASEFIVTNPIPNLIFSGQNGGPYRDTYTQNDQSWVRLHNAEANHSLHGCVEPAGQNLCMSQSPTMGENWNKLDAFWQYNPSKKYWEHTSFFLEQDPGYYSYYVYNATNGAYSNKVTIFVQAP